MMSKLKKRLSIVQHNLIGYGMLCFCADWQNNIIDEYQFVKTFNNNN